MAAASSPGLDASRCTPPNGFAERPAALHGQAQRFLLRLRLRRVDDPQPLFRPLYRPIGEGNAIVVVGVRPQP